MLLVGNPIRIVIKLLCQEQMLRILQFHCYIILNRILPHEHNRVFKEVDSLGLDQPRESIGSHIQNLQLHYTFLDLFL